LAEHTADDRAPAKDAIPLTAPACDMNCGTVDAIAVTPAMPTAHFPALMRRLLLLVALPDFTISAFLPHWLYFLFHLVLVLRIILCLRT
jgi:hypothetical protein